MPLYDEEGVRTIIRVGLLMNRDLFLFIYLINIHLQEMGELWDKMISTSAGTLDNIPESLKGSLVYYHQCLYRNRRCLLGYFLHRLVKVRTLLWETGPVIPADVRAILSDRENDYFMEYSRIMSGYCLDMGLDLASDLEVGFITLQ